MISEAALSAFPGIFMRALGMMVVLPLGGILSNFGKIFALSFCLSLFFAQQAIQPEEALIYSLPLEFICGTIIAIPAAITIDAVRSLGELFDNQRGVSFASLYDPANNINNSVMAQLASNYCLILLISAGILENLLIAFKTSLISIPIYSFGSQALSLSSINVVKFISSVISGMFQAFLVCAMLFVLVDIASVFLSKVLNQAGLNQEVFLAKTMCGILLILSLSNFNLAPALISTASPQLGIMGQAP